MSQNQTTVCYCTAGDCAFYAPHATDARKCQCSHTDKPHYMDARKCPLYRLDWQKKMQALPAAARRR